MLLIDPLQCGSAEPSWTRTQIWVQVRMPDYSLNWTARSSAIQTRSVQAAKWARTRSCSRSPNLTPNSNRSGSPPTSSRVALWEGPKRRPPLVLYIVLSEAVKGHGIHQEVYEGLYGIRGQTVLRPSAYVHLRRGKVSLGGSLPESK